MQARTVTLTRPEEPPPRRPEPLARSLLVLFGAGSIVLVGAATALDPLLGAAALAAVAVGLALLERPQLTALLAVALVPATSGLERGFPVPGLRLSELLTVAFAAAVLLPGRRSAPRWRALDWLALLYVVATAGLGYAGALRHDIALDAAAIGTLVGPVQFLLLYRCVAVGLVTEHGRVRALRALIGPVVPVALLAVAQRFGPSRVNDLLTDVTGSTAYDENVLYFVPRVTSAFPHWHVLGGYLMIVALLLVALLSSTRQRVAPPPVLWATLALATGALLLTLTAAVALGLLAGTLLLLRTARRPGRSLLVLGGGGALALAAGWPLIAGRVSDQLTGAGDTWVPETLSTRMEIWTEQYAPVLADRLLLGYGPTLPPEVVWRYTESLYVSLLLRGGVLLLLVHTALFAVAVLTLRPRPGDPGSATDAARALRAATIVLVPLHAVFPYFVTTGLPHVWWVLLALGSPLLRDQVQVVGRARLHREVQRITLRRPAGDDLEPGVGELLAGRAQPAEVGEEAELVGAQRPQRPVLPPADAEGRTREVPQREPAPHPPQHGAGEPPGDARPG